MLLCVTIELLLRPGEVALWRKEHTSLYCSRRRPEFGSQYPCEAGRLNALSWILQSPVLTHSLTTHTHTHNLKIMMIIIIKAGAKHNGTSLTLASRDKQNFLSSRPARPHPPTHTSYKGRWEAKYCYCIITSLPSTTQACVDTSFMVPCSCSGTYHGSLLPGSSSLDTTF